VSRWVPNRDAEGSDGRGPPRDHQPNGHSAGLNAFGFSAQRVSRRFLASAQRADDSQLAGDEIALLASL